MPEINCGFSDSSQASGSELLAAYGPTLPVYVGFDIRFWEGNVPEPELPSRILPALVDTGASHSCIDSEIARDLGLPVVDQATVGGVGGALNVDVFWAQLYAPELRVDFSGQVAGVHLNQGEQPHLVLIGRDFLQRFTMVYEGRTGAVRITDSPPRPSLASIVRKFLLPYGRL